MAEADTDIQLPEEGENLEEIFNEAANVVQTNATSSEENGTNVRPTDSQLLELYGLYKVATTGPCKEPKPGIFNMKARTKWSAWSDKSELTRLDAMNEYIKQVIKLYNWIPIGESLDGISRPKKHASGFGPAVSRPPVPEEEENPKDKDTPIGWVKDNNITKIQEWIASGKVDINLCDEDGLSLLHWAADRAHKDMCEVLLKAGANPMLLDEDDQTPMDYAQTCEHTEIVKLFQTYI